jgi:hypothetical protein
MRCLVLLLALGACQPYVSAGSDASWHVHGPLATALGQTVVPRTTTSAAVTPATPGGNYSFGFGMSARDFSFGVGLHATDVTSDSLSIPTASTLASYATSPHYVTGGGSLDVSWTWLRVKLLSTSLHVGPSYDMLLDRMTGARNYGPGVRYGAGLTAQLWIINAYVDLYREALVFNDGPAAGFNSTTGVTIGIALRR